MSLLDRSMLQDFLAQGADEPVVMLNLVRFAPGGAARYQEYFEHFSASGVSERYGVTVVYGGAGHDSLVSPREGDWDMVVLVRYPSRRHFVDMVNDPDYQSFEHLRAEAVAEAVLQPTTPAM
ncbi:uncharacterized protein (DUF1330 family) [Mycolicibacterium iranicum]|uniref:Uncharacterized protein (DUF1330 family) n=1 Tax=Mycolicibacterium iranicum TaxID=912594 RepID=A0A839QLJ2_MYCIR|nr:DUF1330 domain-containing protein [Mycolicibacterium iranicum]MBB2993071.1 uncharacterized protein (DUF1330 family) [Mycolicibacterium iranicum]